MRLLLPSNLNICSTFIQVELSTAWTITSAIELDRNTKEKMSWRLFELMFSSPQEKSKPIQMHCGIHVGQQLGASATSGVFEASGF